MRSNQLSYTPVLPCRNGKSYYTKMGVDLSTIIFDFFIFSLAAPPAE